MADSSPSLRVCLAQRTCAPGDVSSNLATMERAIAEHAADSDVVVFPECFLQGYGSERAAALAEAADGASFQRLAAACRQNAIGLVYSYCELSGEQRYIALQFISARGESLARYRKSQYAMRLSSDLRAILSGDCVNAFARHPTLKSCVSLSPRPAFGRPARSSAIISHLAPHFHPSCRCAA